MGRSGEFHDAGDAAAAGGLAPGRRARAMRPFSLTVALLVALGACHTAPTEPAEVGSLSIDPSTATVPMSGTLHLSITARDINGRGIGNPAVTFQTSAPLTATVDNAGVVSGLMVGPVTISATSGQRTATASIQVSPRPAAALGLGTNFACALTETGAAYCWGKNDEGQLGDGTTASTSVPVPVAGGVTFSAIAVGTSSACGLIVSGAVNCWGNNDFGALGNGTRVGSRVPVPSAGQLLFESLSGGGGSYCGLTADAVPYCWGNTYSGQLGNSIPSWSLVPVQVQTGGAAFRSISSGLLHACGLTSTGLAYCWGGNTFSQLGDGTSISRSTPAPVGGGLLFTSIDPGASTTCGIATGIAYCWGSDFFGSLGQGTTAFRPDIKLPAPLVGGTSFVAVRAGPGNNIFTPGCGIKHHRRGVLLGRQQQRAARHNRDARHLQRLQHDVRLLRHTAARIGRPQVPGRCAGGRAYLWHHRPACPALLGPERGRPVGGWHHGKSKRPGGCPRRAADTLARLDATVLYRESRSCPAAPNPLLPPSWESRSSPPVPSEESWPDATASGPAGTPDST